MFEPQKLIPVTLAVLLLAPFGFVFWLIAVHQPRPEGQRRAELLGRLFLLVSRSTRPKTCPLMLFSITTMRELSHCSLRNLVGLYFALAE